MFLHFETRKWHSINVVPSYGMISSRDSETGQLVRYLELTLFGTILSLSWEDDRVRDARGWDVRGPLYSRKRKTWSWRGR